MINICASGTLDTHTFYTEEYLYYVTPAAPVDLKLFRLYYDFYFFGNLDSIIVSLSVSTLRRMVCVWMCVGGDVDRVVIRLRSVDLKRGRNQIFSSNLWIRRI